MNRIHRAADSLRCLDEINLAGFSNYSADLIYGSPLLNDENWKKNVDFIIEKNIPHISCYALTVEPKTALDKMIRLKKKEAVDPGKQASQFILLMEWMEQAGYEHYEISNFAKPGQRSKHNSSYWMRGSEGQALSYYGFGPSAHSFDGISRKWNIANNALYIQSLQKEIIPFEEEILTPAQQLNEYVMTALRTIEGIDLAFIKKRFGTEFTRQLETSSIKWINDEKIIKTDTKLKLTGKGKLFADGIAADLFF